MNSNPKCDNHFSTSAKHPTLRTNENNISYGNQQIKAKLEKQSVGEMIVHFFKELFGIKSVENKWRPDYKEKDPVAREPPEIKDKHETPSFKM
ncbi:hypothetical protein [Legionella fallonii]|uniref:hypothetical protein n=1 Tax=Legionella fallonii TaxID=96230 RepID=UPI00081411F6|nr:hypothetical protein [Legionella fallonii]